MGNRRFHKIECLQTLGTAESERLKVTALNLFHLTASPLSKKSDFFRLRHSLQGRGELQDFHGSLVTNPLRVSYMNFLIASIPFLATSSAGCVQYSGLNISMETGPS